MEANKKTRVTEYSTAPSAKNMPVDANSRLSHLAEWLSGGIDPFIEDAQKINWGKIQPRQIRMHLKNLLFAEFNRANAHAPVCLRSFVVSRFNLKSFDECLTPARMAFLAKNESPLTVKARIEKAKRQIAEDSRLLQEIENPAQPPTSDKRYNDFGLRKKSLIVWHIAAFHNVSKRESIRAIRERLSTENPICRVYNTSVIEVKCNYQAWVLGIL